MSATIRLTRGSVFCAWETVNRFFGREGLTRRGVKNEGPGITALPFRGRRFPAAPTITTTPLQLSSLGQIITQHFKDSTARYPQNSQSSRRRTKAGKVERKRRGERAKLRQLMGT